MPTASLPAANSPLTPEQIQKFSTWLAIKSRNPTCPVCMTNQWTIGPHMLNGQIFSGAGLIIGGPSYPMVFMTCNNCSYVRHFMAVPIGIVSHTGEQNV
jgi:hypothetical protein